MSASPLRRSPMQLLSTALADAGMTKRLRCGASAWPVMRAQTMKATGLGQTPSLTCSALPTSGAEGQVLLVGDRVPRPGALGSWSRPRPRARARASATRSCAAPSVATQCGPRCGLRRCWTPVSRLQRNVTLPSSRASWGWVTSRRQRTGWTAWSRPAYRLSAAPSIKSWTGTRLWATLRALWLCSRGWPGDEARPTSRPTTP
mmetsp:Transcript_82171/g.211736  ORF Transcript_82171/g.211736 Transcript_82171/m.211736 type:complete len:203 (+) Transcript_82171:364-972(+)